MQMTKKIILGLTLLICLNYQAISQEKEKRLSVSYLGEYYTHPGMSIGYAQDFYASTKEKTKKNGKVKIKERRLFWSGKVGVYHQKESHTGIVNTMSLGHRKTKASGYFTEYNLGAGHFTNILSGKTYTVDEEGEVNTIDISARWSFVTAMSIGIGKDLSPQLGIPLSIKWSNGLWLRYPFNGYLLPQLHSELGFVFKF